MDSEFIRQAKTLAEKVFKTRAFEKHVFHNYDHTQDVVNAVSTIGQRSNLSADEMESALVAAWLHDIGYENGSKNHEQLSAQKAKELLESIGAPQKKNHGCNGGNPGHAHASTTKDPGQHGFV